MASIDKYKHQLLGFIECPSDHDIVHNSLTRKIAIYQLLENIPKNECDFDGKINDLIVGGGSGEVEALRLSTDKCIDFFFMENFDSFNSRTELFKPFWFPAFSYKIGNGFIKLGWDVEEPLEQWLAERVIRQLMDENKVRWSSN